MKDYKKYIPIFITGIILVGLIVASSYYRRSAQKEGFQSNPIPNIWWTYWNKDTIPEVVQLCIDSWRKWYPEMEFRIVTPKILANYTDLDPKKIWWNDMPARESDIVRANLLQNYGGYWCDATNYFTERVEFPMRAETEFVGYYIDGPTTRKGEYPVLENWFFGTIPKGPFMTKWRDAFMSIGDHVSINDFLTTMRNEGVDFQSIGAPSYLAMHIAAQYVFQKEMGPAEIDKKLVLLKAEDGPFAYLAANKWGSHDALKDLCTGNNRTTMIKFRGAERGILERDKGLRECIFEVQASDI